MRIAILALMLVGCAHTSSATTAGTTDRPTAEQLYAVARVAESRHDKLRAQQYYMAALQAGYDSRDVTPRLLRLFIADGQYRLAISRAKETLDEHGDDPALRLLLAELYRATDLDVPAEHEYQHVLERQPNNAQAHLELALLLQQAGRDAGRADEHLRAYLALEPHGAAAEEVRGRLMKELP